MLAIYQGYLLAFTHGRISTNDVMRGLYKYDMQSSDDGFNPIGICKKIYINHWGTLLSRVPLHLDDLGWCMVDNQSRFKPLPWITISQEEYLNLSEHEVQAFLNNENMEEQYYDTHQV